MQAGLSLRFPFYFIADHRGVSVEEVRRMPWAEFVTWLGYFGFFDRIEKSKSR